MLSGSNKIRDDVLEERLDERVAPSLGGVVLGSEDKIYVDPREFFKRTLVTESMLNILENVINVVSEGRGFKVVVLSAFFGGGKTHTLLALYHAVKNPETLKLAVAEDLGIRVRLNNILSRVIDILRQVDIIIIDGSISQLAPSPLSPLKVGAYSVNTLWGYIAHSLGRYDDLREHDYKLVPPQIDELIRLLSGRRIVIVVDEIAHYVQRLFFSPDPILKNYAQNVVTFFEALVKAVDSLNNAIIIISLPVKITIEKGEEYEETYRTDITRALSRAIHRVAAQNFEPVKPKDVPSLLRVRLFEKIDEAKASEVVDLLRKEYERNKNIFGEVRFDIREIKNSYPFHSKYISALLDILDKHEGLQKTRDLLRISRKVLRHIIRDEKITYDLIMPWHIDIEEEDIGTLLLSHKSYEGFKIVVEEDITKKCSDYQKSWLAKIVAKSLFIKTFIYGEYIVPRPEFFPTPEELAVLIYEPAVFREKDLQPKDIAEAIDWVTNNLLYVLRDEKTRRIWFTKFITPIKYVEERASRIYEAQVYPLILEATRELMRLPLEDVIEKKRKGREVPRVFDVEFSRVSRECTPLDLDTRRFIVYACIDMPLVDVKRVSLLEEVVFRTSSGGLRRYANTIYVIYPESRDLLIHAVEYAKKCIACEEVEKEGIIDLLVSRYGLRGSDAEILKKVYEEKLEAYCNEIKRKFYYALAGAFNKIAYPVYLDGRNTIKEVDVPASTASLVLTVESVLRGEKPEKIKYEIDYDTLEFYLKKVGVDLKSTSKTINDVIDYFYSNPILPAIPEEAVKNAIAEGLRKLEIGLKCGSSIYFKHIVECEREEECLGVRVVEGWPLQGKNISNECEVLPQIDALKQQMELLRQEMMKLEKAITTERTRYYLVYEGKLIPIEDVLRDFDKYSPESLIEAPLVKRKEKLIIRVEPEVFLLRDVDPERELQHIVRIEKIGPFEGRVFIRVDNGVIEPSEIEIDKKFTSRQLSWTLKAPKDPGEHILTLKVESEDGKILATAKLALIVKREKIPPEGEPGLPPEETLVKKLEFRLESDRIELRPVKILVDKLRGFVKAENAEVNLVIGREKYREVRVRIEMSNVSLDDFFAITTNTLSRFATVDKLSLGEAKLAINLVLLPLEGSSFKMPKLSDEEVKVLRNYTRYWPG